MNANPAGRASVVAAVMVVAGALLSGLISMLFLIGNFPSLPRQLPMQDPIGFALRPNAQPLAILAMLLALIVLAGLTWFFTRMVVRGALPHRGSAVFFGTWGVVVIAAWIAGIARAPLVLMSLGLAAGQPDFVVLQGFQLVGHGTSWALAWGWITAIVVTMIHRSAPVAQRPQFGQHAGVASVSPNSGFDTYPPQPTAAYSPQPGAAYPLQPPAAG